MNRMTKRKFTLTDKELQQLIQAYEQNKNIGAWARYQCESVEMMWFYRLLHNKLNCLDRNCE